MLWRWALAVMLLCSTAHAQDTMDADLGNMTVSYDFTVYLHQPHATPAPTTKQPTTLEEINTDSSSAVVSATDSVDESTDTASTTENTGGMEVTSPGETQATEDSTVQWTESTIEGVTAAARRLLSVETTMQTTMVQEETTTALDTTPTVPHSVIEELMAWLDELYANHTEGYKGIQMTDQAMLRSTSTRVDYTVTYSLGELQHAGKLAVDEDATCVNSSVQEEPATGIQEDLCLVAEIIVQGWNDSSGEWAIETEATQAAMVQSIITVGEEVADSCGDVHPHNPCTANYTCHMNETGMSCMEKCVHFTTVQGHCSKDFLTESQCVLIGDAWDPYPYCDCGSWGAMDDYYDGHQCVSASFIVGMSAGLGALVILIFLCIVAWLAADRNDLKKELEDSKPFDDDIGSSVSGQKYPAYVGWNGNAQQEMTESTPNVAYENQAYEPVTPDERSPDDPYKDFQVSLEHIDTTADYSIKRPHVVRPTDSNYSSISESAHL